MKTTNPVLDTLVESQTSFVNNWMDSAKKFKPLLLVVTLYTKDNLFIKSTSTNK